MVDKKNIILIAIVILVIALAAVAAFIYTSGSSHKAVDNITNTTQNKTVINVDKANNTTVVGDNTTRANNTANNMAILTYFIYSPLIINLKCPIRNWGLY